MSKVNLTNKSIEDQVRIIKDYLIRRSQHKNQGEITVSHLVNRFKHNRLISDKAKAAHFNKLLRQALQQFTRERSGPGRA
ncbi:MAG: hypothetical protein R6W90_05220 [Ignavibacteriaceae bacterium]